MRASEVSNFGLVAGAVRMHQDDHHRERLSGYAERLARFAQRHTFGEAAMRIALEEAECGAREGEVPVGAVV